MIFAETGRARVIGDARHTEGRGRAHQHAQQADASRQMLHLRDLCFVHAGRVELAQAAVAVRNAQRSIARVHQLARQVGNALQNPIERQLGGDRQCRFVECAKLRAQWGGRRSGFSCLGHRVRL
jgi:hypothetical protein